MVSRVNSDLASKYLSVLSSGVLSHNSVKSARTAAMCRQLQFCHEKKEVWQTADIFISYLLLHKPFALKGLSFKPSGDYIVAPIFCLLSWILQILATCSFFYFAELCKVWRRLDNIYIRHFRRIPPPLWIFGKLQKQKTSKERPL